MAYMAYMAYIAHYSLSASFFDFADAPVSVCNFDLLFPFNIIEDVGSSGKDKAANGSCVSLSFPSFDADAFVPNFDFSNIESDTRGTSGSNSNLDIGIGIGVDSLPFTGCRTADFLTTNFGAKEPTPAVAIAAPIAVGIFCPLMDAFLGGAATDSNNCEITVFDASGKTSSALA